MQIETDYILVGTGIAPLLMARKLIDKGKNVVLVNPEYDFFSEDCELSFDPSPLLKHSAPTDEEIKIQSFEEALELLRPLYPGPLESWPQPLGRVSDYVDSKAPFLRGRSRIWLNAFEKNWESFESLTEMYKNSKVQMNDSLKALSKVPGLRIKEIASKADDSLKGLLIHRVADLDLVRFKGGVFEFLKERLSLNQIYLNADTFAITSQGLSIKVDQRNDLITPKESILFFWTPKLTHILLKYLTLEDQKKFKFKGVCRIEEWTLHSREKIDPLLSAVIQNQLIMASYEGSPLKADTHALQVYRRGSASSQFASDDLQSITHLISEVLGWDSMRVRSMKYKYFMEWEGRESFFEFKPLENQVPYRLGVLTHCDGGIFYLARHLMRVCERILSDATV